MSSEHAYALSASPMMSTSGGVQVVTYPIEGGLEVLALCAPDESTALIATGRWLQERANAGVHHRIEDIDWTVPGEHTSGHTLHLTLSTGDAVA
ncbi:hypothetical protein [Pseudonocardia spinosispora]|uniref:hypothetical protein n=1 Tax=Pseudonocardia spinosispora TaxID=103441 RepID=UPI00048E591C|nr:hypothetical protein [Pseudonocardia spinosispora]